MDYEFLLRLALGYFVSCVAGHFVIRDVIRLLWDKAPPECRDNGIRPSRYLSMWLGMVERFFYTSMIFIKAPEGIVAWLAFKAVMRWKKSESESVHACGTSIFQIGALLSICFGIIGGLIVLGKYTWRCLAACS